MNNKIIFFIHFFYCKKIFYVGTGMKFWPFKDVLSLTKDIRDDFSFIVKNKKDFMVRMRYFNDNRLKYRT